MGKALKAASQDQSEWEVGAFGVKPGNPDTAPATVNARFKRPA
jgi:hypothetical protein